MAVTGTQGAAQSQYPAGGEALVSALERERSEAPDLWEMMKEAKEKGEARRQQLQLPKNSARYGDAPLEAYARLSRAKNKAQVSSASGYARRQIAQLQAAKRTDPENAQRIQAAINQLQKAVNRAGRKKREISQEKLTAKRHARLEKEKRTREAKRLRHQLKCRQTQRMIRESGYLREADIDNRMQDHIAATKQEMRQQMEQLTESTQSAVDAAVQQYAAAAASTEPAPAPEISVEA